MNNKFQIGDLVFPTTNWRKSFGGNKCHDPSCSGIILDVRQENKSDYDNSAYLNYIPAWKTDEGPGRVYYTVLIEEKIWSIRQVFLSLTPDTFIIDSPGAP